MTPSLPIQLSAATGVPRYRQIVDQVETLIRSGVLRPGDPLPSVRELASQLTVSLITTRRAYSDLAAAGLIVQHQGRGSFVAEGAADLSTAEVRGRARRALAEAVDAARRLGVEDEDIRELVDECLGGEP